MQRLPLGSAPPRHELSSEEANGWDRKVLTTMQHQQVIENFVTNGQGGRGTYLKADEDVLYSKFPVQYRPYGWYDHQGISGQTTPLAVHLGDDNLLVNGAGFSYP